MPDATHPLALEPIAARAWRAAEESGLGGWRLYASSGFSGRINACWPLEPPGLPLDAAIDAVEAWYDARRLPTVFKIVESAMHPPGLAAALRERGYSDHTPTIMMVGDTAGARDAEVIVEDAPDADFEGVFVAAGSGDPADARERLEALGRMAPPRGYARIAVDGRTAAIGACAVEGGWTGVFAMRTIPEFRRRGLAQRLFATLMAASRDRGARRAYLQVEAVNAPAIALYAAAGFREAYQYRYWTRP